MIMLLRPVRSPTLARQQGFTLAEVAIVLAVIALLIYATDLTPFLRQKAEVETDRRLADIQQALTAAYRQNQWAVEANAGAILQLGPLGNIDQVLPAAGPVAAGGGRCGSTAATFAPIANLATASAGVLFRDGASSPMCVFITGQLTRNLAGVALRYHTVAIVAPGNDGRINNVAANCPAGITSFNAANGDLNLCGDDKGVVIDGYQLAVDNYKITQKRMDKIAAAYEIYFTTRATVSADPSIDYFANNGGDVRWDSVATGAMPMSSCQPQGSVLTGGPDQILGLGPADVTDAFGRPIFYDNCSNAVRSPAHPTAENRVAPFSAAIVANLPGGVVLRLAAVGLVN